MSRYTISWRHMVAVGGISLLAGCAQPARPTVASNPPPVAPGPNAIWYTISFDTDSYTISPEGQNVVRTVAAYLQQNPASIATIIGRTDTVGGKDYNMHLSHRRSDAVRDLLVYDDKLPEDRVEARWTGETRPRVTTADDVAVAANRVVDIAIH